jgi:DNA-binding CsgD family transcriptional regulator
VHATAALARAINTGMIESMVSAYRGTPELVVCLLQQRALHDDVDLLLTRAGDKQVVLPESFARGDRSVMSLSPREKEVLALLAQGMSNAQIGKSLYISPMTVKVHVRHIFEKLGVRSRAAAAVRATQLNRD